jgi:hypothetical protein
MTALGDMARYAAVMQFYYAGSLSGALRSHVSESIAGIPSNINECNSSRIIFSVYVAGSSNSLVPACTRHKDSTTTEGDSATSSLIERETSTYDATGLALHYNDPREAPDYMQKCTMITA